MNEFVWTVRVRAEEGQAVSVHARNLAFPVGEPVSFRPADSLPSALEHLLGALAADLIGTFRAIARRRRIPLDALEFAANATLTDPLAHVGVIGQEGDPSLQRIYGALYVSTDEPAEALDFIWKETLLRSPIYRTLSRAADIQIRLEVTV